MAIHRQIAAKDATSQAGDARLRDAASEIPSEANSDSAQGAAPSQSSSPPSLPDYELLRRIGGGSYGEVWLARTTTGVLRAVKIVWRHTFDHDRPFEREFEGIQNFERLSREHPSQLALYHVGRGEGYFFLVMELADAAKPRVISDQCAVISRLVEQSPVISDQCAVISRSVGHAGADALNTDSLITDYSPHTLRAELAQGRLPAERVLELGLTLTTALAHLHKNGLVHRDIKPSNIIFAGGQPKLADIGLVTDTGDARSIVGTEGYLAPEGPGTPQADLFALGKVLYEAATGLDRRQFPQLPPDLRAWPDAALVFELNEVLLKASVPDASARYQNCEQMHADLLLLQSGISVKRRRNWKRHWTLAKRIGLAALVVVALAAVLINVKSGISVRPAAQAVNPKLVAEAEELARQGWIAHHRMGTAGVDNAERLFNEALEKDPNCIPAHAGLANVHARGSDTLFEPKKTWPVVRKHALKILELDPNHWQGHEYLGRFKFYYEWDFKGAEREFRRAVELNPNDKEGHACLAYALHWRGAEDEARQQVREYERVAGRTAGALFGIGWYFWLVRDYARAVAYYQQSFALDPTFVPTPFWLARAYMDMGPAHYAKALTEVERPYPWRRMTPSSWVFTVNSWP